MHSCMVVTLSDAGKIARIDEYLDTRCARAARRRLTEGQSSRSTSWVVPWSCCR